MIVNAITPKINFGQNAWNFRPVIAFDEARTERPVSPVYSYTERIMKQFTHPQTLPDRLVIGVSGESACGKTTIAKAFAECAFENNLSLSLISMDNYIEDSRWLYRDYGNYSNAMKKIGDKLENPGHYQLEQMRKDLERLKRGETIKIPEYNFTNGASTPEVIPVKPSRLILVEGLFANYKAQNDVNVYIDCADSVRYNRARARAAARGQTIQELEQMWDIVQKGGDYFVKPLKEQADVVLNGEADIKSFVKFFKKLLNAYKK